MLLEMAIIISALTQGAKVTLFATAIYMFGIVWIWPTQFINGITWVSGAQYVFGVYVLDYVIPVFALASISLIKKIKIYWLFPFIFLNYISHVSSGIIFWSSYAWGGWGPVAYSVVVNMIQLSMLIASSITIYYVSRKIKGNVIVQDGYVNDSFKVKVDGKYYQKRVPKYNIANWENELNVYKILGINIDFNKNNGEFLKPWIKGKTVKKWNAKKIDSLKEAIEDFHTKDYKNIIEHDWMIVEQFKDKIDENAWKNYLALVQRIRKHKKTLSHNDINGHNVLYSNGKIILIDFEWTRVNSIYFDYAQFEVAEKVKIIPETMDNNEYIDTRNAIVIFNYLWTFSMPDSNKINKLRAYYLEEMKKINH